MISWVEHVACMKTMRNVHRILVRKSLGGGGGQVGELDEDGRTILK